MASNLINFAFNIYSKVPIKIRTRDFLFCSFFKYVKILCEKSSCKAKSWISFDGAYGLSSNAIG
jgi:hypothetical protein